MPAHGKKQTDFLGGPEPNMDARMCGIKAFNVLVAISGLLIFTSLASFVLGVFFTWDLLNHAFLPLCEAFWILVAIFFLRSSYVYLFCAACGLLNLCCAILCLVSVFLLGGLAYFLLPKNSSDYSTTTRISLLSTSTMEPLVAGIMLGFVLVSSLINIISVVLGTIAFWKLSGRCGGGSADVEQDRYAVKNASTETEKTDG